MNEELRELQLVDLRILKDFINVCKENDITYFALGGTLLGAVRHKGFIPWDDDIDVGVPREDYDKLLKIFYKYENEHFRLFNFKDNDEYYRYFSRIEDSSIKLIRTDNLTEEISSAWIDVFPLDGMPNNAVLRKVWKYVILYHRAMYKLSCFDIAVNVNKKGRPLHERFLVQIGKLINTKKFLNTRKRLFKLDKALKRFPYKNSKYLVNAMGAYKFNEMFNKEVYGNGSYYDFEDIKIFGPTNYDFVCKQLYGDYMTPPNEDERNHHESSIIQE